VKSLSGLSEIRNVGKWHGPRPEGHGRGHDNEAGRLVQDHRLERGKAEHSNEKRKAELGSAKADQPAQRADDGTDTES